LNYTSDDVEKTLKSLWLTVSLLSKEID
jgi:hypothetical protein